MKWFFEPGHTAAEFRARHMMVTWVRGQFKNVEGRLEFDPSRAEPIGFEATLDARGCSTGDSARDEHLRSVDFLDCARYATIRYVSTNVVRVGASEYRAQGDLTIKDVTRSVTLDVRHLGTWETPWWEGGVDKGPKTRAGFTARTRIDRYDFGVKWNGDLPNGGIVVGRELDIVLDVEAIREG